MTEQDERSIYEMDYSVFVNIISTIPSCIFFKNVEGRYLFASQRWGQLNSVDIVGKTDLEVRKDRENAIKGMEADREIVRTKKGCRYTIECDVDGVISYLELIKEPVIDSDGAVIGIVGLINDITETVLLRNQILEMKKQLEEQCDDLENSNRELQTTLAHEEEIHKSHKIFSASMNHELRSPLNGIIGILQLMLEDKALEKEHHESLFNAYQSSQYMLKIVNEWLDYAKMETNEFRIKHEPFIRFNEKENSNIEGSGLGMSIVKRIIEQMHGSIDVKSKLNEGTVFTARIPVDEYSGEAAKVEPVDENIDYSHLKVLCVDDVSVNITILTSLLKKNGIQSDSASSADEAIEKANACKYDIILMDHMMPKKDGIEAFETIRGGNGMSAESPVIMLTANADSESEELYKQKGLDGYLTKPIIMKDLIKTINDKCF